MKTKKLLACKTCGSVDILIDSYSRFDYRYQNFTCDVKFNNCYCINCNGETSFIEVIFQNISDDAIYIIADNFPSVYKIMFELSNYQKNKTKISKMNLKNKTYDLLTERVMDCDELSSKSPDLLNEIVEWVANNYMFYAKNSKS